MFRLIRSAVIFALALLVGSSVGVAQLREDAAVRASSIVLDEIMAIPVKSIPQSLLADAEAIAIVPNVVKGSFVVGVRHGKGVVLVRDESGGWMAPQFVSLTGGSVGFQIGVQATDVILVFKSKKSVEGLLKGKFTIGADAAAAAGPVGRQAAAATDGRLQAEIYSYSRSRGLFAGVSLDGSVLDIDRNANTLYYRPDPRLGLDWKEGEVPPAAVKLVQKVAEYSQPPVDAPVNAPAEQPATTTVEFGPPVSSDAATALRGQLAASSQQLLVLVEADWQRYLALPAEVYTGHQPPAFEALQVAMKNYDAVAGDPRYKALSSRAEFRSTHQLLRQYAATIAPPQPTTLQLPPPPR